VANVGHLLSSDFLSGSEIPTPQIVTIKSAEIKELGTDGEKDTKVVLEFYELPKALPCNKTRLKTMVENFGVETGAWVGKTIMIYGQKLSSGKFAGQWTVILTKAPTNGNAPAAQPAQEEAFTV
jgi:hypothetical protein